jgi:LysM repeat protein
LQGVKYLYVDDESAIDSELFEKLSKDGTILVMYEGSVYVTEDAYDKYISETPTDATSAKADNTAEGESNRKSDNEYIVLDVDGNLIYLVEKGDTLTDVSSRISYSVDEIAEYNHIKDVNLIYAGETLRVPVDNAQAEAD